jgi:hypothetical protein
MSNGPWQFDISVVLLKDYAGSVRPSDMVFDTMEIWVRVLDLPMDMMNRFFGELIGGWVGKFIAVDVDKDGIAWGKELRIRVAVRVDQPLIRGVSLKNKDDDPHGTWFDLKYEKIPHFCFDCGCLVHPEEGCSAEREKVKQWGEWLRASPRKTQRSVASVRPSMSSSSYGSWSSGYESRGRGGGSVRDLPLRRNLWREQNFSESSRTGGDEVRNDSREVLSPEKLQQRTTADNLHSAHPSGTAPRRNKQGTFVRRHRDSAGTNNSDLERVPLGSSSNKRGPKQVWLPVKVQVVGEGSVDSAGKRQRTGTVFDRLEDQSGERQNRQTDSVSTD